MQPVGKLVSGGSPALDRVAELDEAPFGLGKGMTDERDKLCCLVPLTVQQDTVEQFCTGRGVVTNDAGVW